MRIGNPTFHADPVDAFFRGLACLLSERWAYVFELVGQDEPSLPAPQLAVSPQFFLVSYPHDRAARPL